MLALTATVLVTELESGSESSAHFQMGEDAWVSLAHGVHPYRKLGESHRVLHGPVGLLLLRAGRSSWRGAI